MVHEKWRFFIALVLFVTVIAGLEWLAVSAVYLALAPTAQQRLLEILTPEWALIAETSVLRWALLGVAFTVAYQKYGRGALQVAEGINIILNANPAHRFEPNGPAEIQRLRQAVNDLAERGEALARDLAAKIAQAKSSVEEEKNRLAALMSELSQGVLVCNTEGRILLYNEQARQVLGVPTGPNHGCAAALVGLGRSIFTLMDRNLLAHALEDIQERLARNAELDPNMQFTITTRAGQFVRVRMAPVLTPFTPAPEPEPGMASRQHPPSRISGLVMTLEDVTSTFKLDSTRDMLLQALTEGSRAPLANIRAAVESLMHYPDCEAVYRDRFLQVIDEEARALSQRLDQTTSNYADSLKTRWPLEPILGIDLIAAAQRRIESSLGMTTEVETLDESLWLRADSYTLVQALVYLAHRLRDECGVQAVCFNLARQARVIELDLIWSGSLLALSQQHAWETEPLQVGGEDSPLTLSDVADRHAAEMLFIAEAEPPRALFRLLLPLAHPVTRALRAPIRYGESRPEFYDFDLFHQPGQTPELDQVPLAELAYTVFDTETTGLEPSAGDEIISIGAVRIVNGRLLWQETFEQLIDPKRPITALSQTIHGISQDMLRGQPTIEQVLPQFHAYCDETVLVGHNAAFDMRFLELKQAQTAIRFTQPLLDTLLLSEVLHSHQGSHALEAIAERLGVTVVARHNALGDALVTAEVFLRMVPLLAAQGIHTLRDAREATEKIYAKVKY